MGNGFFVQPVDKVMHTDGFIPISTGCAKIKHVFASKALIWVVWSQQPVKVMIFWLIKNGT